MKYLCLVYHEQSAWRAVTEADRGALLKEPAARGGAADAFTLRFENGKVSIADRPPADAKHQLGGVLVLEARDLNHAIQLMSRLPCTGHGSWLEIRPIDENPDGEHE